MGADIHLAAKRIWLKIIGLEILLMFFYMVNGAFVSIMNPTHPVLQFIGLIPLAIGVFLYLLFKKKWDVYFFKRFFPLSKQYIPLVLVLLIIVVGNKGLDTSSFANLFFMFLMQLFIVAFIEETFFRGFMLKLVLPKGKAIAVLLTSFLFGITHSIQLFGGQSIEDTILQIIYAFIVGLVLSLLIVTGHSILVTIAFHGFNNFLNFMGNTESHNIFAYLILIILIGYSFFLWNLMTKPVDTRKDQFFLG